MVQGEDLEENEGLDRLQGQQGLPGQAGGHWEGGVGVSLLHEDSREAILLSAQSGKNLDCWEKSRLSCVGCQGRPGRHQEGRGGGDCVAEGGLPWQEPRGTRHSQAGGEAQHSPL